MLCLFCFILTALPLAQAAPVYDTFYDDFDDYAPLPMQPPPSPWSVYNGDWNITDTIDDDGDGDVDDPLASPALVNIREASGTDWILSGQTGYNVIVDASFTMYHGHLMGNYVYEMGVFVRGGSAVNNGSYTFGVYSYTNMIFPNYDQVELGRSFSFPPDYPTYYLLDSALNGNWFSFDTEYHLRMELSDQHFHCYFNNVLVIDITPDLTDPFDGYIGLDAAGSVGCYVRGGEAVIENFYFEQVADYNQDWLDIAYPNAFMAITVMSLMPVASAALVSFLFLKQGVEPVAAILVVVGMLGVTVILMIALPILSAFMEL